MSSTKTPDMDVQRSSAGKLASFPVSGALEQEHAFEGLSTDHGSTRDDAANMLHLAEEVRDASVSIPRVMMATWALNYTTILLALVAIAHHMPDIDLALDDTHLGLPSHPRPPTVHAAAVAQRVARRHPAAFNLWKPVVPRLRERATSLRLRAIATCHFPAGSAPSTACPPMPASLVYIGSPVAFYACYCLSIGCLLWRRIAYPETLPPAKFSLGAWGVPMNSIAVVFSFYSFFWCFWLQENRVTAAGFNWASPLLVVTGISAFAYYFLGGRKKYHGPVVYIEAHQVRRD
ncbi:hypothetical protein LLEC1_03900 [Akanthomyces lecanii]|uniref:Uncharacterized protein n=1 Tax=Cordyceps confragosa TaxID=2714763 RepID=A0A179I5X3_CORDF|nr:hypothetical protein LLEC1_03900 [Akanthomyces lecanii]